MEVVSYSAREPTATATAAPPTFPQQQPQQPLKDERGKAEDRASHTAYWQPPAVHPAFHPAYQPQPPLYYQPHSQPSSFSPAQPHPPLQPHEYEYSPSRHGGSGEREAPVAQTSKSPHAAAGLGAHPSSASAYSSPSLHSLSLNEPRAAYSIPAPEPYQHYYSPYGPPPPLPPHPPQQPYWQYGSQPPMPEQTYSAMRTIQPTFGSTAGNAAPAIPPAEQEEAKQPKGEDSAGKPVLWSPTHAAAGAERKDGAEWTSPVKPETSTAKSEGGGGTETAGNSSLVPPLAAPVKDETSVFLGRPDNRLRPPCTCGRVEAPCLYRWNVAPGEVRFECCVCGRVLGGNSSNSHLHMAKEHGVDDPCVVWLDTGKSTHRKHRSSQQQQQEEHKETVARRANPKSNGKSTCSPACWEHFVDAVLERYTSRQRRPNEAIFDQSTPAEQFCDVDTHTKGGTVPPTAKTVQGKWAAIREHLVADRSTSEVAGSKAAPLYCWLVDVWAVKHPERMKQLRTYAGGMGSKPTRKPSAAYNPNPTQQDEDALRSLSSVARSYHELLYRVNVSCWVANPSGWRGLLQVSSSVIEPAVMLRLRDFPFLSLVTLCQSSPFEMQPVYLTPEQRVSPGDADYDSLARRLVEQCGMLQCVDVSLSAMDVTPILRLVAHLAQCWFSVFRRPELQLLRLPQFSVPQPLLDEQPLQQAEASIQAMVCRLPGMRGAIEAYITQTAMQLGPPPFRSGTDQTSVAYVHHSILTLDHALNSMHYCVQTYLRLSVWQRCRAELLHLSEVADSQLGVQPIGGWSPSRLELADFLRHTRLRLGYDTSAPPSEGAVVAVGRLLHDTKCAIGLTQLLAELRDCSVQELLQRQDRLSVQLWYTLLKLAALYLATDITRTVDVQRLSEHRDKHSAAASGANDYCLLCAERRLRARVEQLLPWQRKDESSAWMKEVAQQAGVNAQMFVVLAKLNDMVAGQMDGAAFLGVRAEDYATPEVRASEPHINGSALSHLPALPPAAAAASTTLDTVEATKLSAVPAAVQADTPPTAGGTAATVTPATAPDELLCAICGAESCDVLLVPCLHVTCCQPCALSLLKDKQPCPLCSAPIQRILPIRLDQEVVPAEGAGDTTAAAAGSTNKRKEAALVKGRRAVRESKLLSPAQRAQQAAERSVMQADWDAAQFDLLLTDKARESTPPAAGGRPQHPLPASTVSSTPSLPSSILSASPTDQLSPALLTGPALVTSPKHDEPVKPRKSKRVAADVPNAAMLTEPSLATPVATVHSLGLDSLLAAVTMKGDIAVPMDDSSLINAATAEQPTLALGLDGPHLRPLPREDGRGALHLLRLLARVRGQQQQRAPAHDHAPQRAQRARAVRGRAGQVPQAARTTRIGIVGRRRRRGRNGHSQRQVDGQRADQPLHIAFVGRLIRGTSDAGRRG